MPRAARPLSKPRHDPLHIQIDNDQITSIPSTRRLIHRQKNRRENSLSDENQASNVTLPWICFFNLPGADP